MNHCFGSQVVQHLLECNFQFPARDLGDRKIVNEIVASFVHRFEGTPDPDWQPGSVLEICSNSPCYSERSDSDSGAASANSKDKSNKRKKRKTVAKKREEEAAKKAEKLKDLSYKGMEGRRWKGFIYIHPSCRSFWVKLGLSSNATRRADGQNSTTFGPDLVARKVELDLGDMSTTSKAECKKRLKNAEKLCRVILRKHHHHRKREVISPAHPVAGACYSDPLTQAVMAGRGADAVHVRSGRAKQ